MFFPAGLIIRPQLGGVSGVAQKQQTSSTGAFSRSKVPRIVLQQENKGTTTTLRRPSQPTSQPPPLSQQRLLRPKNPSILTTRPMRPTSSEQQHHYSSHQRPQRSISNRRSAARSIDKRAKAKKRAQNNKRRDVYKLHSKDGRVKQLVGAQGNAYNARPKSSSSTSPRSRDTWVVRKTPRVAAYQAPRSTTIDTAFTSMAGTVSASPRRSEFKDPRQRRPFRDMVEVKKLTEHQQALQQRHRSQSQHDISILMSLGLRRRDATTWCDDMMNVYLRVVLKHLSIINGHRSHDFMELQASAEEQKPKEFLLLYECREEVRTERENTLMLDVNKILRAESTHGNSIGNSTESGGDLEEDYAPLPVVDLREALKTQRDRMLQLFRTLSVNQKLVRQKLEKFSAYKIQSLWWQYYQHKRHTMAFVIQQRWAQYMCSVLNHRVSVLDFTKKSSALRIQKWFTHSVHLRKSSRINIPSTWLVWLDNMIHNHEYDQYDHEVSHACIVLQCAWRCCVARVEKNRLAAQKSMRERRRRRRRWEKRRGGRKPQNRRDVYLAHRELVMWHTQIASEMEHVNVEIVREHRLVAKAWKRWEIHMRKQIYNKTIPNHYITQVDTGPNAWKSSIKGNGWNDVLLKKQKKQKEQLKSNNGMNRGEVGRGGEGGKEGEGEDGKTMKQASMKQQWLDLRTGEMTDVHPHCEEANELSAKESAKCQIILKERIEHLDNYRSTLNATLLSHQNAIGKRIVEMCSA